MAPAIVAQAGAAPAATAPIIRGVAPLGIGNRETSDQLALSRLEARDQSRLAVHLARPMTVGQHPTLSDATLPAAVLVLALIAWFLAARDRTGQALRRRTMMGWWPLDARSSATVAGRLTAVSWSGTAIRARDTKAERPPLVPVGIPAAAASEQAYL